MSRDGLDNVIFVKQRMVSVDEEGDEEVIFETTLQVEEGEAPSIINIYQDTEGVSLLEGNIKTLPSVLTVGRTIYLEDIVELWRIDIAVVDNNETLEEKIRSIGAPVTKRGAL